MFNQSLISSARKSSNHKRQKKRLIRKRLITYTTLPTQPPAGVVFFNFFFYPSSLSGMQTVAGRGRGCRRGCEQARAALVRGLHAGAGQEATRRRSIWPPDTAATRRHTPLPAARWTARAMGPRPVQVHHGAIAVSTVFTCDGSDQRHYWTCKAVARVTHITSPLPPKKQQQQQTNKHDFHIDNVG